MRANRVLVISALLFWAGPSAAVDDACDLLGDLRYGGPLGLADSIYHGDSRYDYTGQAVATGDFNGDGLSDLAIGSPGFDDNGTGSGAVAIFWGDTAPSGNISMSTADVLYLGNDRGYRAGWSLSNAGDIDGDGKDDLIIGGGPGFGHREVPGGIAWLVLGENVGATIDLSDAYITFEGGNAGDEFGTRVAGVGDVDNDGTPDILIGAPYVDDAVNNVGAAYLYTSLPASGPVLVTQAEATTVFMGSLQGANTGAAVGAAGDINGDGIPDLGIGAPGANANGNKAGAAYYFLGGPAIPTGTTLVDLADTTLRGNAFDRMGGSIGNIGDINNDGFDDMAVGAKQWGSSKRGAVLIKYGSAEAIGDNIFATVYDHRIRGSNANDLFGASISGRVDFDADGKPDMVVGAVNADGPSGNATGAAWVIHGDLPTELVVLEEGAHWSQHISAEGGHSVAAVPDINGDGFDDVLIGSFQSTHISLRRTGIAALFFGGQDVQDEVEWYEDADMDGYGDSATATVACEPPGPTWIAVGGDCDDTDPAYHPYAIESDCGSTEDFNCDGSVGSVDIDGDGIDACDGDCDDNDPLVNPTAAEVCFDGIDNDCSGEADDSGAVDAQVWAPDIDGDGYGDSAFAVVACEDPGVFLGTVVNQSGDCDDFDPAVNIGAAEFCDEIDNDCDNEIDEDDAIDALPWYLDNDVDLYGDRFAQTFACVQPDGYVENFDDCDDTNADVVPGANEVCDFIDNDCDGLFYLGGPVEMDNYVLRLTGEDIFGRLGREAAAIPDYTGDGLVELAFAAPYSENVGLEAGAVYIRNGAVHGGDFDLAEVRADGSRRYDVKITPTRPRGLFGSAIASGDVNGDGLGDLVVGSYLASMPLSGSGVAYVFYGPLSGALTTDDADAVLSGGNGGAQAGIDVAVGDADGDGIDDILIGSDGSNAGGNKLGEAYLIYGSAAIPSGPLADVADAVLAGDIDNGRLGSRVSFANDLNGDGFDDIVAGAITAGPLNQGEVHIVLGSATRFSGALEADSILFSSRSNYGLGLGIGSLGDVNDDGIDDIGFGTKFNTVYVVYGAHSGVLNTGRSDIEDVVDVTIRGRAGDKLGANIETAGDVNGDGYSDFLLSATTNDAGGTASGATFLIYGKRDLPGYFETSQIESYGRLPEGETFPTFSVDNLGGVEGAFIFSGEPNRNFGSALAGASDLNGDGFDDFLIGAAAAHEGRGQVVIMYGGPYGQDWDVGETGGGWSQDVEVDGSSEDWSEGITFDTTQPDATGMITWTDSDLYFGAENESVQTGTPSTFFLTYIGDGSGTGTTTGINFNTQQADLLFAARYAVAWRGDDGFRAFYEWNGSSWAIDSTYFDTSDAEYVLDPANQVIEFRIPMEDLGFPSRLEMVNTWLFEGGGFETHYAGVPSVAFSNGDYDPDFAEYYGFALDADLGPSFYGTLPTGGGAPLLDGTWETYCWNMDLDPSCSDEGIVFQSCPMHAPQSFASPNNPQILGIPLAIGVQDDCDDRNPRVHPGATEVEGNSVDEDCDGADGSNAPPFINLDLNVLYTDTIAYPDLEYGDPDQGGPNETELTVTYEWTVIDVDTGATSTYSFFTLDGDFYFDKGDTVTFSVTVTDGATVVNDSVTRVVLNTPPQVIQCKLLPQDPTIDDPIVAVPEFWDEDRDDVTWSYQWANGGVIDGEETGGTFPSFKTRDGIGIAVSCTADDGEDTTTDVSTPVYPADLTVTLDTGDSGADSGLRLNGCTPDRFELNNHPNNATDLFNVLVLPPPMTGFPTDGGNDFPTDGPALASASESNLTLCPGNPNDSDYFVVPLDPSVHVEVDLNYGHIGGNPLPSPVCAELVTYNNTTGQETTVIPCLPQRPNSHYFFSGDILPSLDFDIYFVKVHAPFGLDAPGYFYDIDINIYPNLEGPEIALGAPCVDADAFEPNDSRADATALAAGSYTGLHVCGGEAGDPGDWYAIELNAGERLDVTTTTADVFTEGDVDIELYDGGFRLLRHIDEDDTAELAYWTARTQTVYLRVIQDEGNIARANGFTDFGLPGVPYDLDVAISTMSGCLMVDDSNEDNDTFVQAQSDPIFNFDFEFGQTACGGDQDWFQVRGLDAGELFDLNLYTDIFEGSLRVSFIDVDGSTVLYTTDTPYWGDHGGFVVEVPADGDYYVLVEALWADADRISVDGIDYDLETSGGFEGELGVCAEDYLETNNDPGDATPVGPGFIRDLSHCQVGDRDWFAIDVEAGETVDVFLTWYPDCPDFGGEYGFPQGDCLFIPEGPQLEGFPRPIGDLPALGLGLFDANGVALDWDLPANPSVDNGHTSFTASEDMVVYIQTFLLFSPTHQAPRYDIQILRNDFTAPPPPLVPDPCIEDEDEDDDAPTAGYFLSTPAAGQTLVYSGTDRTLCTDDDVFDVYLPIGSEVEVEITFDHGEGDVDVWGRQLEGANYIWRANSVSTDDDEAFSFIADVSADHTITVLLFDDIGLYQQGNSYDYTITITVPEGDSSMPESGMPMPDTYDTDMGCLPYEHTIVVDGSDEDWRSTETFRTTSRGDSVTMFSWDADYFYFGARHSVIEFGGDDDIFNVYFGDGTAVGFDYGIHHGEQEADILNFTATDVVRWKADGQFSALHRSREYLLFSYWDIYPNYFQSGIDGSQMAWDTNNQVVEFAIPRSEINFNSLLQVAAIWYHEGEEDPFAFAATPDNMFFEYTFDPDIASHLEFDNCRPGGPRGGQVVGQGIGVACYDTDQYEPNDTIAASTEGLLGNQLNLMVCDDDGDYYTVFLAGTMTTSATYDPALGELNMTVYDEDQNVIGTATGSGGFVSHCFDESTQAHGNYYVQVWRDEVHNGNEPTIYDFDVQSSAGATCSAPPPAAR